MRVPILWLKEYVEITEPVQELAETLTSAGLEVTALDRVGLEGGDLVWDREKVILAHLLKVEAHPQADKLVLATVDYGAAAPKVLVTGAPNLRPYLEQGELAELGLWSPCLLEGSTYLDPYKDFRPTRLKGKNLRGIYNDAMLSSPAEIGLWDDHEGVLLLTADDLTTSFAPGTPLQDVFGDTVLEIDVIPNIARCASMVGVAREVAALTGAALRLPNCEVVMEGAPIDDGVTITAESPELNPRFVALVIEGVEQRPSPFWMQHRLRLAGQRPINVVVDISNYVMLELGQPNHTFDYDFLRRRAQEYDPQGRVRIVTRLAHPDEKITTLDGAERALYPNNILVTDPQGNLSVGGIMGGANSEIQPETTNVLLEAAAWNFINIRQSSRQLGLMSEAGFRFSRGVHPSQALLGAKRAAELLRTLAGGTVAQGIVDCYPQPEDKVTVALDPEYVRRLSGVDLSPGEMTQTLRRLSFEIEEVEGGESEPHLSVTVPDYRLDIEGPHDLVEEICRIYGYDRVPSTVLGDTLPPQRSHGALEQEERIKDNLVDQGLHEVVTYRLTTPEAEARAQVGADDPRPYLKLTNPPTSDRAVLRHSLLASVLEVVAANSRFQESMAVFEIGHVFLPQPDEALPKEALELVLVMTGLRQEPYWQGLEPPASSKFDFFDLKGVVEGLAQELKVSMEATTAEHPSYRPGRTARLVVSPGSHNGGSGGNGEVVGTLGELHPLVVERYDMRLERDQPVLAASLDLDALLPRIPETFKIEALAEYPALREDLALVVDADRPAEELAEAMRTAGQPLLRSVELFDVYAGDKVGAGKKSLAYHLTFQSPRKTLKDKEVEKLRKKILKQVEAGVGATLRE